MLVWFFSDQSHLLNLVSITTAKMFSDIAHNALMLVMLLGLNSGFWQMWRSFDECIIPKNQFFLQISSISLNCPFEKMSIAKFTYLKILTYDMSHMSRCLETCQFFETYVLMSRDMCATFH